MKTIILSYFTIVTITNNYGQEMVLQTSPLPSIYDLKFIDKNIGFSAPGCILKTQDGGYSMDTVFSSTEVLTALSFPTPNIEYTIGINETIFKTTDQGNTLIQHSTPTLPSLGTYIDFTAVSFCDSLIGYISVASVNPYIPQGEHYGAILKRLDDANTLQTENQITTHNLKSIYFVNDSVGYIGSEGGQILKTMNAGELSINNRNTNESIVRIFPNPAKSEINLSFSKPINNGTIEVFDVSGIKLKEIQLKGRQYSYRMFTESLATGIYVVSFKNNNSIIDLKELILMK